MHEQFAQRHSGNWNYFYYGDGTASPGGGTTNLGGGTVIIGGGTPTLGGGTPDRGGGTPFRPVPAEFNHCLHQADIWNFVKSHSGLPLSSPHQIP